MALNPPAAIDRRGKQPLRNFDGSFASEWPTGGKPDGEISGGGSALSWTAPGGLSDGSTITVTTDGTYTLTPPDGFASLGFGDGWLYSNAVGTPFETQGDWNYEFDLNPKRFIYEDANGVRFLKTRFFESEAPAGEETSSGGMVIWDTGSDLQPGDVVSMSSYQRMTAGTVEDAYFQWKQERVKAFLDASQGNTYNTAYFTETGVAFPPETPYARLLAARPDGTGDERATFEPGPVHDSVFRDFVWAWKLNSDGNSEDGRHTMQANDGQGLIVNFHPQDNSGNDARGIYTASQPAPRFAMVQDYIGNNSGSNSRDIELLRTDFLYQKNGVRFFLLDNADPSLSSITIPMVPVETSATVWTLKLWARGASYSGMYIGLFDELLNHQASVAL